MCHVNAGAYISLLAPGKTDNTACHLEKDYHVPGIYYKNNNKKYSRCEIEYFVETHLCKLCVILRSRVLRVACPY